MAKRRTKKQKENTNYQASLSWQPTAQNKVEPNIVKGESKSKLLKTLSASNDKENAVSLEDNRNLSQIKFDLAKSLIASLIITGLEVVLYLIWI